MQNSLLLAILIGSFFFLILLFNNFSFFAVALSYSVLIMDEEVIPVTANDVLVGALVSPFGCDSH